MKQYDGDDGYKHESVQRRRILPLPARRAIPPIIGDAPVRAPIRARIPSEPELDGYREMTRECIGCGRVQKSNRILSARLRSLALRHVPLGITFPFRNGIDVCQLPSAQVLAKSDKNKTYVCGKLERNLYEFLKQYDSVDGHEQQNFRRRTDRPPIEREAIPPLPPLGGRAPMLSQPEMTRGNSGHNQDQRGAKEMYTQGSLSVLEPVFVFPKYGYGINERTMDLIATQTAKQPEVDPVFTSSSKNKNKRPCLGCNQILPSNRPMTKRLYFACVDHISEGRTFPLENGIFCKVPPAAKLGKLGSPETFTCMALHNKLKQVLGDYEKLRSSAEREYERVYDGG